MATEVEKGDKKRSGDNQLAVRPPKKKKCDDLTMRHEENPYSSIPIPASLSVDKIAKLFVDDGPDSVIFCTRDKFRAMAARVWDCCVFKMLMDMATIRGSRFASPYNESSLFCAHINNHLCEFIGAIIIHVSDPRNNKQAFVHLMNAARAENIVIKLDSDCLTIPSYKRRSANPLKVPLYMLNFVNNINHLAHFDKFICTAVRAALAQFSMQTPVDTVVDSLTGQACQKRSEFADLLVSMVEEIHRRVVDPLNSQSSNVK